MAVVTDSHECKIAMGKCFNNAMKSTISLYIVFEGCFTSSLVTRNVIEP
jgi:hypothetical protein